MRVVLKCLKCKETFEHFSNHNRTSGPKKEFCDDCKRRAKNEYYKLKHRRLTRSK